ncbi:MAG: diacylglycerol/lipid kinase family protein [Actinomycetes bacterium]
MSRPATAPEPTVTHHLLVNADAGTATDEAVEAAAAAFRAGGVEVAVHTTDDPADVRAVVDDLTEHDVLVVCGGDGSLHVAVAAADAAGALDRVTFAVVPLGTGNDLATSLGTPQDPAEAATALLAGAARPADLLRGPDGAVCVNALHLGVGVDAAERAAEMKEGAGDAAYPLGALAAGTGPLGWALEVEVDGAPVRPDGADDGLLLVAVCNGPTFGGGARVAPDAAIDDGELDVVVSAATGPMARGVFAAAMRRGTAAERDDTVAVRGTRVVVTGDACAANVDGELDGIERGRHAWEVDPGAWILVRPARS